MTTHIYVHLPSRQPRRKTSDKRPSAGIMYLTPDNKVLLLKRGDKGDYPGQWAFPGGHLEEGESHSEAARREFHEETGHLPEDNLSPIGQFGHFRAYTVKGDAFKCKESDESAGNMWADLEKLPDNMHPIAREILGRLKPPTKDTCKCGGHR